ncbi:hypothetical protein ACYZUD_13205 [Pseudomonas sp. XS1P51]
MFDKSLSFIAGMNIRRHPVTLISSNDGSGRMGTQVEKTDQMQFGFYYFNEGYLIAVLSGEHRGKWIRPQEQDGFLAVSEKAGHFVLKTTQGAVLTLENMRSDVQTIYLQSHNGSYVQQNMEGLTAFDDLDVLYNFMLAVPKTDRRGDGTYLAMIQDQWSYKPLSFTAQPAFINLHIVERGLK